MVEDDYVDSVTAQSDKGFSARCRGRDLVGLAQEESDHLGNDHVVVYNQDLLSPDGRSAIWISRRRERGFSGRRFGDVNARVNHLYGQRERPKAIPTARIIAPPETRRPLFARGAKV